MSEFWLWFWRPIAEILGTVAMIAGVICLIAIGVVVVAVFQAVVEKVKGKP